QVPTGSGKQARAATRRGGSVANRREKDKVPTRNISPGRQPKLSTRQTLEVRVPQPQALATSGQGDWCCQTPCGSAERKPLHSSPILLTHHCTLRPDTNFDNSNS